MPAISGGNNIPGRRNIMSKAMEAWENMGHSGNCKWFIMIGTKGKSWEVEKDGVRKAIFVCHAKVFEFYMTSVKLKGF